MSHYLQHRDFFDKPVLLSEKEMQYPLEVLDDFFTDYRLSEIREINDNIVHVCLTNELPHFNDPSERDQLLNYRQREEKALEAALLLLEKKSSEASDSHPKNAPDQSNKSETGEIDLGDLQTRVLNIQSEVAKLVSIVTMAWSAAVLKKVQSEVPLLKR